LCAVFHLRLTEDFAEDTLFVILFLRTFMRVQALLYVLYTVCLS